MYCQFCGNTHQWQIDLKLRYEIESSPSGLLFSLEPNRTKRILSAIENNVYNMLVKSYYQEKPIFRCANCDNTTLDIHELIIENCYFLECPGCFHCDQWITKEWMIELCSECIRDKQGMVDEDYCSIYCPHFENGMAEVREHYTLSLGDIKRQLGYLG